MSQKTSLMLCVVCAIVLIGCSKSETTTNRENAAPPSTSTSPTTAPAKATTAGEKIGVPECDDFIAAYDACVSSKVPEAARDSI